MRSNARRPVEYAPSIVPDRPDPGWFRREFERIHHAFLSRWTIPVSAVAPDAPVEGMLRYADGTLWNPGGGKGLYVFDGAAWVKL